MLIIREVFIAKPGQASKLAKLFRKAMTDRGKIRILTDFIGEFNTVVMETEVESLAEFERQIAEYRSGKAMKDLDPETAAEMSKYSEMFLGGRREVMQVIE